MKTITTVFILENGKARVRRGILDDAGRVVSKSFLLESGVWEVVEPYDAIPEGAELDCEDHRHDATGPQFTFTSPWTVNEDGGLVATGKATLSAIGSVWVDGVKFVPEKKEQANIDDLKQWLTNHIDGSKRRFDTLWDEHYALARKVDRMRREQCGV